MDGPWGAQGNRGSGQSQTCHATNSNAQRRLPWSFHSHLPGKGGVPRRDSAEDIRQPVFPNSPAARLTKQRQLLPPCLALYSPGWGREITGRTGTNGL